MGLERLPVQVMRLCLLGRRVIIENGEKLRQEMLETLLVMQLPLNAVVEIEGQQVQVEGIVTTENQFEPKVAEIEITGSLIDTMTEGKDLPGI